VGVGGAQKGAGCVGGRHGRGPRRACVRAAGPRWVAGKAELTAGTHGVARESGCAAKRFSELTRRAHEAESERGAGEGKGRRQSGPTGHRERGKPPLTGGAHLSEGAGARLAPLGWTGPVLS
jgi:hypothetical protein